MGKKKKSAYRILVGKSEEKRPLGKPRRRWVDNIKMDLREIGWDCMDWIDLAQDRDQWRALVNTVMNFRVPQNIYLIYNIYSLASQLSVARTRIRIITNILIT
jgi:hypothetical protein